MAASYWRTMSEDLVAVVRSQGPTQLCDISRVFQAAHGKNLNLLGLKLRDCLLDEDKLKGSLVYDWRTGMLELAKGQRTGSAWSPPEERLVSPHVIDSEEACSVALLAMSPYGEEYGVDPSLERICEGRAIAVELEGSGLGTEEGKLSLVKVGRYQ